MLYSVHCTGVQYTVYRCSVYSVQFTVHSAHVQCAVHAKHYIINTGMLHTQCAMPSQNKALYQGDRYDSHGLIKFVF